MKYALIVFLIIIVAGAIALLVLSRRNLFLFSPVKGIVTRNNVPLSHVKISQSASWGWSPTNIVFDSVSNNKGEFVFPPIVAHNAFAVLSRSPIHVKQTIQLEYDGLVYEGWVYNKDNYDIFSELGGTSFLLVCELTNKESEIHDDSPRDKIVFPYNKDAAYGICRIVPSSFLTKE